MFEKLVGFLITLEVVSAQFLHQPSPQTVFAPVHEHVTLTCSVEVGYVVDWKVVFANGESANSNSTELFIRRNFTLVGVATSRSTLSLWETEMKINNGTNITCLAREISGSQTLSISGNTVQVIFYEPPFIQQPNQETVYATIYDQVTLTCSVEEGFAIDWRVIFANGEAVNAGNSISRAVLIQRNFTLDGLTSTRSTLSLQKTATTNATNITCLAIERDTHTAPINGRQVQVIFYGVPPPPTDLSVIENQLGFLNISWSLGFIEGVLVNYTLTVLNLNTTSAQPIIIAGLLDQHYVFETSSPCDVYSFAVSAVTAAGNSTPSQEIIFGRDISIEMCFTTIPRSVSLMTSSDHFITLVTTSTTSSPPTNEISTFNLIIIGSAAFIVLMVIMLVANVILCAFCCKKTKAMATVEVNDPVYEIPLDVAPPFLAEKTTTPFVMTSSSAYGVSTSFSKLPDKPHSLSTAFSSVYEDPKGRK